MTKASKVAAFGAVSREEEGGMPSFRKDSCEVDVGVPRLERASNLGDSKYYF